MMHTTATPQAHQQPTSARKSAKHCPAMPAHLAHLANVSRFVCWRFGSKKNGNGKYPKMPFNPQKQYDHEKQKWTYKAAETDNPATWGTFAECEAALQDWPGWFGGWGIVLLNGDIGIDCDSVVDNGVIHPFARAIVDSFAGIAYAETSVSNTGIHIIALGNIPDAFKTDYIEVYSVGRFFTVSGNELPDSAAPAPAQTAIDALVLKYVSECKRNPKVGKNTSCCFVSASAPHANDIAAAANELPNLIASLEDNKTSQLRDLLVNGTFPSAVKDTSPSGARAVVVAQLLRAPKRHYTDTQIVTLARWIWKEYAYEGGSCDLDGDANRLIRKFRPPQQQAVKGKTAEHNSTASESEPTAKNPVGRPATRLAEARRYILKQERTLNGYRISTASMAAEMNNISQRQASKFIATLVEREELNYVRRGNHYYATLTSRFGAPQAVKPAKTAKKDAAKQRNIIIVGESPVLATETPQPENEATLYNTVLDHDHNNSCSIAPDVENDSPVAPTPTTEQTPAPLTLAELVSEAIEAFGTQPGKVKPLDRVKSHVRANGTRQWPDTAIEAVYRTELERRSWRREESGIEAMDVAALARQQKAAATAMARGLAPKPQRKPPELEESESDYQARINSWQKARKSLPYWRWRHGYVSEVLERKRTEMTARTTLAPAPLLELLDRLEESPLVETPAPIETPASVESHHSIVQSLIVRLKAIKLPDSTMQETPQYATQTRLGAALGAT
jgi:hypothetical protein